MEKLFERNVWSVLGLPFDAISLKQAAKQVADAVDTREPCFISTPNVNFVINALEDEGFYRSVIDSDLSLADGMPILWVAKLLKVPLPERVAGSDLFRYLTKHSFSQRKIRVFFFGGPPGAAEQAHKVLNKQMGAAVSCGYLDPGFVGVDEMSTPEIIDNINTARADFIVVALGAKKGQQWIMRNRGNIEAPVISHLGAVINFVAGSVKRAPIFWQKLGMEWLWRMKQEPGLWRRYFSDALCLFRLLLTRAFPLYIYSGMLRLRLDYRVDPVTKVKGDRLILIGRFSNKSSRLIIEHVIQLMRSYSSIYIDMSGVTSLDNAFLAKLLLLDRQLNKQNKNIKLVDVPASVRQILKYAGLLNRFQIISGGE